MEDRSKNPSKSLVDYRVTQKGLPPGRQRISCLFAWMGRKGDFNHTKDPASFKGLSRYFNTWTNQGRSTVAAVMLVGFVGMIIFSSNYRKKQEAQRQQEFIERYCKDKI